MGLTVNFGLSRFYNDDTDDWVKGLVAIVETGVVDVVRDVLTPSLRELHEGADFRVVEVQKAPGGVEVKDVPEAEAAQLLTSMRALFDEFGGTSAQFSWEQVEANAFDVQDLALVYAADADPMAKLDVELSEKARMISLERSMKFNWKSGSKQVKFARKMHEFAREHKLIVHSA